MGISRQDVITHLPHCGADMEDPPQPRAAQCSFDGMGIPEPHIALGSEARAFTDPTLACLCPRLIRGLSGWTNEDLHWAWRLILPQPV